MYGSVCSVSLDTTSVCTSLEALMWDSSWCLWCSNQPRGCHSFPKDSFYGWMPLGLGLGPPHLCSHYRTKLLHYVESTYLWCVILEYSGGTKTVLFLSFTKKCFMYLYTIYPCWIPSTLLNLIDFYTTGTYTLFLYFNIHKYWTVSKYFLAILNSSLCPLACYSLASKSSCV